MEDQFDELALNPDVIIATPDGLMNYIIEAEGMSLRTVEYVVLDEADSLLSMGFAEQLQKILLQLSETRQTLVFCATLPKALAEVAKASLRDPKLLLLDEAISSDHLSLAFFTVRPDEKVAALLYLIREQIGLGQQTMIFVSTKYHVQFLNVLFRKDGIESSMLYSDMDQDDQDARKINISNFRDRKTTVLIVTDVAARGIDTPLIDNVVNWDFPLTPKSFVHRVG
ncbi:uncharacterized protein A4U43_C03F29410 [Asparagus officinalis]|uniref:Helicase ATP-binding domain-containing protein n=1 Tax=Asparagus officinalis TaxID=4686 RepID=A0A5P1FGM1_ASPOF|nr:uncharacterized protein A4U43_C03F29410 [Asparagus officinalis]